MKIMNKAIIKIVYKDGNVEEIPARIWDDYQYIDRLFVVKRRGIWIGIYNMDSIACIFVG